MKKYKYLIIILTTMIIYFFPQSVAYSITQNNDINLETLISNIKNKNMDIKLLDEQSSIYLKKSSDAIDDTTELDYQYKAADLQHQKKAKMQSLELEVKKSYYECNALKDEIALTNDSLNNLNKKIDMLKKKIDLGLAKDNDLSTYILQKSQIEATLYDLNNQLQQNLLNIKKICYIDINQDIDISQIQITFEPFDDNDIENKIKNSVEKSYDLSYKQNLYNLELKKYNESDINSDLIAVKQAEVNLSDAKPSREIELWTLYYNLKNLENNVYIEKINYENYINNYNISKIQYLNGQINALDLEDIRIAMEKQKISYQRSINSYMISKEEFENELNDIV
ncbi:hypothetical protein FDN13_06810 [Caloramator sp. E03]|uniref:TolC family protein n=1 Tax=Caloramator sp. E03 TaxID=2576307 RepID=UPI0011102FAB|nr:TolC family protein [Caloramator sp. E03]QCX33446.1 hypothetical protein FDN13_06810 [Caloramator sp. E03]